MGANSGLYGGAITTYLPDGFLDASLLREVPDTQEVYVNSREEDEHYNDGLGMNESILIDLLESVEENDGLKALKEHVAEITSFNGSAEGVFAKEEQVGPNSYACIVLESVAKWGKKELQETVVLCVGLIRLPDVHTDVVITVNVPVNATLRSELEALGKNELPPRVEASYDLLLRMIHDFKLVDRSLFV